MEEVRLWRTTAPDYNWVLRYHRSHRFLRFTEPLMSLYAVFYAVLCVGLLATPDLVVGPGRRGIVVAGALLAMISAVAIYHRLDTKRASIFLIIGCDVGTAAVLLSLTPSPFAILATTIATGIGNYAACFHGATVFVCHHLWMAVVLGTLFAMSVAAETWPLAANMTAAGTATVVLFTSSVIMHALVAQLRHDAPVANFDPLTGLRNRRGLTSSIIELRPDLRRPETIAWTIAIDLDGFKSINDEHGHDCGDYVLRRTAARIESAAPSPIIAARVGGEEFTVLGIGTDVDARECADRILASIHDETDEFSVTASLGVATQPCAQIHGHLDAGGIESAFTTLAARADAAMYEAKRQGGHRVVHAGSVETDPM